MFSLPLVRAAKGQRTQPPSWDLNPDLEIPGPVLSPCMGAHTSTLPASSCVHVCPEYQLTQAHSHTPSATCSPQAADTCSRFLPNSPIQPTSLPTQLGSCAFTITASLLNPHECASSPFPQHLLQATPFSLLLAGPEWFSQRLVQRQ